MRSITSNTQDLLNQNMGTELMVLVEIEWVDGGSIYYSDQDIEGAKTKILELGGFDTSMMLEGANTSQELKIVLDDTDNNIREIYDNNDIHKRPAKVYILHKNQPLLDKILVFRGELVTPIEWDETQRSVSFNIMSKLNSKQVGFSMEEGDFPNIPSEALGKPWPLVFGQVCNMPAVKVRTPRRGYLTSGTGIKDCTLQTRICQALRIQCPTKFVGMKEHIMRRANGFFSLKEPVMIADNECLNRRMAEICRLRDLLVQQEEYEHEQIEIYNGVNFPQEETVTITIDDGEFVGSFTGNTFYVDYRIHPKIETCADQECQHVPEAYYGPEHPRAKLEWLSKPEPEKTAEEPVKVHWEITSGRYSGLRVWFEATQKQRAEAELGWAPDNLGETVMPDFTQTAAFEDCDDAFLDGAGRTQLKGGPKDAWWFYDKLDSTEFFWAPSGSEVYLANESEILYIVSLIPGTVDSVSAYRVAPNGFKYLTELPTDYYTVYETDYGGYTVVEIGLKKDLSLYDDGWDSDIYVSFTSDVGPNPCDNIEWLVNKYTDLSIDSSSFASVKASLSNYPCAFHLTSRPDVYKLIQDIAYQSRCLIYVRNDILYIKYLSDEPSSERTISTNDILSGSFVEFLSETENVYTTHNIQWKKSGAAVREDQENERKLILKYNVDKYGTVENSWDYYTQTIYSNVLKTGTFWLIRKANSWKKVKFKLPIKHIDLDVGDCITLNVPQFGDEVKTIIESMNLDINSYTVDFVCWTPIRSGESEPFYWAWPANQSENQIWPLNDDSHGGGGYNFDITPPIGHILRGGGHHDDRLIITSGGQYPSDLGDIYPTITCETSEYLDNVSDIEPEIKAKEIAESAARSSMESDMSGGGGAVQDSGAPGRGTEDPDKCGYPNDPWSCGYKLLKHYLKCAKHTQPEEEGGGGPCECTEEGGPHCCYGDMWTECETYSDAISVKMAARQASIEAENKNDEPWKCGDTRLVGLYVASAQSPKYVTCEYIHSRNIWDEPIDDAATTGVFPS